MVSFSLFYGRLRCINSLYYTTDDMLSNIEQLREVIDVDGPRQYLCPMCNGQLERFSYHQHTWFTKIAKSGKLTKQSRKLDNGAIDCLGFSCTNPQCDFYKTDKQILEAIASGDKNLEYLKDIM